MDAPVHIPELSQSLDKLISFVKLSGKKRKNPFITDISTPNKKKRIA